MRVMSAAALLLLLLISLAAAASRTRSYTPESWDRLRREDEMRLIFAEWKARHGKTYSSIAHEEHRYTIFKEALRRQMDQHNAGYGFNSMQGINQFADLTQEEFEAVCCGYWKERPSPAELQRVGDIQDRLRLVYAPSSL